LVEDGVAVDGIVVGAANPIRGPRRVEFRYEFNGRDYVSEIFGSDFYESGEAVTVYLDPENPRSATLSEEQPQSRPAYFATLLVISGSFLLMGWGLSDAWKTWRRGRRAS
jgi:hypothetical protein